MNTRLKFVANIFLSTTIIFSVAFQFQADAAQNLEGRTRVSIKKVPLEQEPVRITNIFSKAGSLSIDKDTNAPTDWFNNFTIEVENTSGKNIKALGFNVYLSSSEPKSLFYVSLRYGVSGDNLLGEHPAAKKASIVKPGEKVILFLMPDRYEVLEKMFRAGRLKLPTKAELYLRNVYFDDGTKWDLGTFFSNQASSETDIRKISYGSLIQPVAFTKSSASLKESPCGYKANSVQQFVCYCSGMGSQYETYYQINVAPNGPWQNVKVGTPCYCNGLVCCVLNTLYCAPHQDTCETLGTCE